MINKLGIIIIISTIIGFFGIMYIITKNPKIETILTVAISLMAVCISLFSIFKNEIFPFNLELIAGDNLTFQNGDIDGKFSPSLIVPISFINKGYSAGVIEMLSFKIIDENEKVKYYTPIAEVDFEKLIQDKRMLHGSNLKGPFGSFALNAREAVKKFFLFTQEPNLEKYPASEWQASKYTFELYIKINDTKKLKKEKEFYYTVNEKLIRELKQGDISNITNYPE